MVKSGSLIDTVPFLKMRCICHNKTGQYIYDVNNSFVHVCFHVIQRLNINCLVQAE